MVPEYAVRNHTSLALSDPFATKGVYRTPLLMTSIALSDPLATKGVSRTPLLMVPPLPSGHAWQLGLAQYGRADGTTVLRDHMACEYT
jgi:hypothetical protein